jgi:hypothetical protein
MFSNNSNVDQLKNKFLEEQKITADLYYAANKLSLWQEYNMQQQIQQNFQDQRMQVNLD